MVKVDHCTGDNAEVQQAVDGRFVYEVWLFCGLRATIGFARSADHGGTFGPTVQVPGSAERFTSGEVDYSWDPAIAVSRRGTIYVVYMRQAHGRMFPKVAISTNHGESFRRVVSLGSPVVGNFADRPFIATGSAGRVYVTWDYGPSAARLRETCAKGGSCSFSHGDLNAVMRSSHDGGRSWGPMEHVSPGYPHGGVDMAPIVVEPGGRLAVLFQRLPTNPATYRLRPGNEWFTSSSDQGRAWSRPVRAGWPDRTIALSTWWIDCSLARDGAGHLYAVWDTQGTRGDVGWLASSADGGRTWSRPLRATPDHDAAMHLLAVAGAGRHGAYVSWLTDASPRGYALWARRFSLHRGWVGRPVRVSSRYGDPKVWPGDTIGVAALPGGTGGKSRQSVILSWGSALAGEPQRCYGIPAVHPCGEIWSSIVRFH
ncbi:MAG TPA: sialidase family protein [Nocardioidaceae bacterium]|nr:sialidase family protein [Nocardioidaceae bacterium]